MSSLILGNVRNSQTDRTRTLSYTLGRPGRMLPVDVSVIPNRDGIDRLYLPLEIAGGLPLTAEDLLQITSATLGELHLLDGPEGLNESRRPIGISFSGGGDPAAYTQTVIRSILLLRSWAGSNETDLRFSLVTSLPAPCAEDFRAFTREIADLGLSVEVHLSLHFVSDRHRQKHLPNASGVAEAMFLLREYHSQTRNPIEVGYTPILGINDSHWDVVRLLHLVEARHPTLPEILHDPRYAHQRSSVNGAIPVKLLLFQPGPGDPRRGSSPECVEYFEKELLRHNVPTECVPIPGVDRAANLGMFLGAIREPVPFPASDLPVQTVVGPLQGEAQPILGVPTGPSPTPIDSHRPNHAMAEPGERRWLFQ